MSQLKEWRALDHCDDNENNDATVEQEADQAVSTQQISDEWIIIKDSEKVDITTTDIQAAVSLQASIQFAIGIVLNIMIADSDRADDVVQDLNQIMNTRQSNRQKTIVEKSRNIEINTIDRDLSINIQVLIQVLVAIILALDIL